MMITIRIIIIIIIIIERSKSCGGDIIPNTFSLVELDLDYVSDEDSP